jgi:hypothetical protein
MAQYLIRFNGHISWEGRSNGLPETIYSSVVYDGEVNGMLEAVAQQSKRACGMGGMMVEKEPGKLTEVGKISTNVMFVPMHWIVSMDVSILRLNGEMPLPDEQGIERLKDGSTPTKH